MTTKSVSPLGSDAHFSECGCYRYRLQRHWSWEAPLACFVMLNPSRAGAQDDDPTVRKCIGFAQRLGWGGFYIVNLYAYIATKPADLKSAHWPSGGARADEVIDRTLTIVEATSGPVICAWGSHAKGMSRPLEILAMIKRHGLQPQALAINSDGTPAHPLMLPYTCTPIAFGG